MTDIGTDTLLQERRLRAAAVQRTTMLRDEAARLRDGTESLQKEAIQLHAEIARQQDHIVAQAAAAEERRRAEEAQAAAALRDMTADRDRLQEAWQNSIAEQQRLLRSTAWRITAPLRWAGARMPASLRRMLRPRG